MITQISGTQTADYPEPLWFSFIIFHYLFSPVPLTSFAVSFSSEMVILIYSLHFPRLWDILFSLWYMYFECTLLFKFFIRFIHVSLCVGVLATCMSVCHLGAWCQRGWIRRGHCILWNCSYRWLWSSVVGKAQGWDQLLSVSLESCFSPFIRMGSRERAECCHSARFLLFLFVFQTKSCL